MIKLRKIFNYPISTLTETGATNWGSIWLNNSLAALCFACFLLDPDKNENKVLISLD